MNESTNWRRNSNNKKSESKGIKMKSPDSKGISTINTTLTKLFRRKTNSSISRNSCKTWKMKKNHWRKSEKPKTKLSKMEKIEKPWTKSQGWKKSWENSPGRPKNKSNLSTKNKNKSENYIKPILPRKKKSKKSKPKWRTKNPTQKKSTNTPSINSKIKSNNSKTKDFKSKRKGTRKSELWRGKEGNWNMNSKGRNWSWMKKKNNYA